LIARARTAGALAGARAQAHGGLFGRLRRLLPGRRKPPELRSPNQEQKPKIED
jgi:hypothetical protein